MPQREIDNIVTLYKKLIKKEKLKSTFPKKKEIKNCFGKLIGKRKGRRYSGEINRSKMENIQEGKKYKYTFSLESDDWGTPTPGKFKMEKNYTFLDTQNKCNNSNTAPWRPVLKVSKSETIKSYFIPEERNNCKFTLYYKSSFKRWRYEPKWI